MDRIFFHIFWANSENSKIAKIYFVWAINVLIFSQIKEIFFRPSTIRPSRQALTRCLLSVWNPVAAWAFGLKKYEGIPFKLIEDLQQKIYKRIPFNFNLGSIYKGFPWGKNFRRKSFVNFFWNFKLESDFFPHFFCKIRKLENSANLFILNYNWANFQRNRGQKNSSLFFSLRQAFLSIT